MLLFHVSPTTHRFPRVTGFPRLFALFHWIAIRRRIMIGNREAIGNGLHARHISSAEDLRSAVRAADYRRLA